MERLIMKRLFAVITVIVLILSLASCSRGSGENVNDESTGLVLASWDDHVKDSINKMMEKYGKFSKKNYVEDTYAVFDFDNTCTIFDAEDQTAVYQLERMAFSEEMDPDRLSEVLAVGLSDLEKKRGTAYSQENASYDAWITDIIAAYTELYDGYGPFSPEGLMESDMEEIQETDAWKEFSAKMYGMYDLVFENEELEVAYPWITYWFTGMTEEQVYSLAKAALSYYGGVESAERTFTSPKGRDSMVGIVESDYISGISVPDNIKEVMTALQNNGIKVFIVSGSSADVVRAAVDEFGIHDMVTGVIAMTNKLEKGKYLAEYDYDAGMAWLTDGNRWGRGHVPSGTQPHDQGKVTAIDNILVKEFGHGPIAGFMDSSDGFNMCTEYSGMKLVCCFNRASRRVTDGGGLISELAVYQADDLGYDFDKADEEGDTLYVLQGRDENELRSLRNSRMTIRLGSETELLFRPVPEGEDSLNDIQYEYMKRNRMTIREVIDVFAVRTPKGDPGNKLGFEYGFLDREEFSGYHSKD